MVSRWIISKFWMGSGNEGGMISKHVCFGFDESKDSFMVVDGLACQSPVHIDDQS